jgi:DHA1 family tetracycline resistance protein-like MFS transporter
MSERDAPNGKREREEAEKDFVEAMEADSSLAIGEVPETGGGESGEGGAEAAPAKGRKAAITFIFLTIALDMLAMGMIAPVLPKLIEGFVDGSAVRTAGYLGWFGTLWALMQFVCSPILGSLSDRFGRRPIVLLSNLGLGLDYLVMALAPTIGWLFAGRIISGITASSIPTAMAYGADVTPKEKRAGVFGLLSGAFAIGFVLGPAIGGLLGNINPRLPFYASGGLSLINFCYGLFVLPESLTKANRSPFSWKRANPVGSLVLLRRKTVLLGLAGVLLLAYVAQQCLMNVFVLYTDYRYHWTTRTVGISLGLVGICSGIVGGLLVKRVVAKIGERRTMLIGMALGAGGYALFAASSTGRLFWAGIPVLTGLSLLWPTAQSVMSRHVSASEQGQLQGAINGLRGLAGLVGPGLFTAVFAFAISPGSWLPVAGLPFYMASGMVLLGLGWATWVTRGERV